jgi:hypothetical protein
VSLFSAPVRRVACSSDPAGRLHYTSGDVLRAVKFFLSILGASQLSVLQSADGLDVTKTAMDKGALDDFQTAFQVRCACDCVSLLEPRGLTPG